VVFFVVVVVVVVVVGSQSTPMRAVCVAKVRDQCVQAKDLLVQFNVQTAGKLFPRIKPKKLLRD